MGIARKQTLENSHTPWWKTAYTVVTSILLFIGMLLALSPLFSSEVRQWLQEQWIWGWVSAVLFFFSSAVLFILLKDKQRFLQRQKRSEIKADLATIDDWFGSFMSKGATRQRLEEIPHHKLFSKELCKRFYKLEQDFADSSKELFNKDLREAVASIRTAYQDYWESLEPLLDAPYDAKGSPWDLVVMPPPGGGWEGSTSDEQYQSYYKFIVKSGALKREFLEKIAALEKISTRLRVHAGIGIEGTV